MIAAALVASALLAPAAPASEESPRPVIRSLTYGRYRPDGAPRAYRALRVRALDPDGQIVAISVESRKGLSIADGACDLGGKESGELDSWYLPTRLKRGTHRLRVTVESFSCDDREIAQERSRTVRIRVR